MAKFHQQQQLKKHTQLNMATINMQPLVIDNKPDQGFNVCLTQSPVQQNKKQQRLSKMQL